MKKSYRPGRDRRIAQPSSPGGRIAGINVIGYEFRGGEDWLNVTVQVIGPDGNVTAANLNAEADVNLPFEGITMLNSLDPNAPVVVTGAVYRGGGTIEVQFTGLDASEAGVLMIPPMQKGWGDAVGRVVGGFYGPVPPA